MINIVLTEMYENGISSINSSNENSIYEKNKRELTCLLNGLNKKTLDRIHKEQNDDLDERISLHVGMDTTRNVPIEFSVEKNLMEEEYEDEFN